jgi:head-tail adaptor
MSNIREPQMLQSPDGEPDAGGHLDLSLDSSWKDRGRFYFVKIHSQSSREVYQARQVRAEVTHVVDVWWTSVTSQITSCHRWKSGNGKFEVTSAFDVDDENRVMRMSLIERR